MLKEELNALDSLTSSYETEFRRVAKEHLRDYVEAITDAVPSAGHNFYICPCCKSGTGNNQHYTPAFHLYRTKGNELHFKCHACGIEGNIFDLAGLVNNLRTFDEKRKNVAAFLGVDLARRTPLSDIKVTDAKVAASPDKGDTMRLKKQAREYISECRSHIGETDYFHKRGFTDQSIHQFFLGYDPEKRMAIIPFNMNYYVGRSVDVGADQKGAHKHYKPYGLRQPLFNMAALSCRPDEPVFVTEAPIDAMSIIQSGGTALALGGLSTGVFEKVLDIYKPGCHFVLTFDHDGPGARAGEQLGELLDARNMPHSTPGHPAFSQFKDANAILMTDPKLLKDAVDFERETLTRNIAEKGQPGNDQPKDAPSDSLDDAKHAAKLSAAIKAEVRKTMVKPAYAFAVEGR